MPFLFPLWMGLAPLLAAGCVPSAPPAEAATGAGVGLPPEATQGWTTLETAHFAFHFAPGSVPDPKGYADRHEDTLAKLLAFFGGPLSGTVEFYVWSGSEEARRVLGRPLAFAVPSARVVHTSPGHTLGHELTHVVVGDRVRPTQQSRLVAEGTAVAFDQSGRDLLGAAREAVRRTGAPSVSVLALWARDDVDEALFYPLAGAFVERLIAKGGKEKFLELLKEQTPAHARAVYGADFDALVAAFEGDLLADPDAARLAPLRQAARERMAKDRARFSPTEIQEIERLYKAGDLKTAEGLAAYAQLVERYPASNRAGCAQLYVARAKSGKEREAGLRRAIRDFDDTWYGDGTQVGAYARALLAVHYADQGRLDEARALAVEVAAKTPDAVEHRGRSLVAELRAKGLIVP